MAGVGDHRLRGRDRKTWRGELDVIKDFVLSAENSLNERICMDLSLCQSMPHEYP